MGKILTWLGLAPTKEERLILQKLNKKGSSSMRVVGRGTLTMSAVDARSTDKAKKFMKNLDSIVN
ncbi:hypothetical protein [Shewanella fidelis]|uniref:Uncharacterized protein n=1 Tax=Shewanella fidelis TaxID=173509 RepID=A0AAW8NJJ2_9GAMM|nr:hypothetical protein [Shewanella fidelis]MDR8523454.1 hypothetical protein [Shewanella fidelis]MDW4813313.1 hypothetical protein [Shewanella fidelis]MDW4817316.1 hypothetical protein [Shewanella fidelis]MDW4821328.1 hypothetical protein [Shewanella fidelis]MDW4824594.1 hypothetical protein [Shewanella fidelis]